jgi:hypothetical protein
MFVSYPSSTRLLLCIQSKSSRTPECFRFHPWNSSPAEWRCTPDCRRLYRMLWGKPPAGWCSSAKFGSHVSLFCVPIFGVNRLPRSPGSTLVLRLNQETVHDFVPLFLPPCGLHLTPLATRSLEPSLLSSPHLEASPVMTFCACSSPAPIPVKPQPAPAILSQESVHTTLSITHHTRKRPSTGPRTTHGPQSPPLMSALTTHKIW